ncbi:GNAT family N-acetyltransferase [Amphibacillus sp. Q70]|uniref:GNAT family N-acetyltransferase n=1 Tax=Amphibacillus sp. Q70 TaxID=3453416 RepID=UPI003F828424
MKTDLYLRPLGKGDLDFIYQMHTNPDVANYWCNEPYTTMEKLEKEYQSSQESDSHRQFILMYGDEKVGLLALYSISVRHRNAEFAIMFDPTQQGKGYATDASRLLIEYGFNQLNLHKLYLEVVKNNEKAIHIYQKVGFQIEGELKQHYFVDGQYYDGYVMSLLRDDYVSNDRKG